jgi:hypothetical protein
VSEILLASGRGSLVVDVHAALHLIRELINAIGVLHESRNVTHGAIAPERLVVTPRGRLVIVEYTLGLALERLQYTRHRLWRDFRIAMPASAGVARFDRTTDLVQIGHVALALLAGKLLDGVDQAPKVASLMGQAAEATTKGVLRPLSDGLSSWLERMAGADGKKPFPSASQAAAALDQIIAKEKRLGVAPAALKSLVTRFLADAESGGRRPEAGSRDCGTARVLRGAERQHRPPARCRSVHQRPGAVEVSNSITRGEMSRSGSLKPGLAARTRAYSVTARCRYTSRSRSSALERETRAQATAR